MSKPRKVGAYANQRLNSTKLERLKEQNQDSFVDGPKQGVPNRLTVVSEEARSAVLQLKQEGVDFIKVHNGLPRDAFFASWTKRTSSTSQSPFTFQRTLVRRRHRTRASLVSSTPRR